MASRYRWYGIRMLEYGVTFVAAVTINFLLPYLAPGDPIRYIIGDEYELLTPEERQEVLAVYGLDQPLHVQYVDYLANAVQGDLGTSIMYGAPVTDVLLGALPWTLLLVGTSLVFAFVLGTGFGALSAWYEGDRTDISLMTVIVFLMSAPGFWVGMLLIAIFAGSLGWFPSYGMRSFDQSMSSFEMIRDILWHMTLPVISLTLVRIGGTYLIARNSVLSTLGEDFLLLVRANGLSDRHMLLYHALPNSMLPIYTRFMLQVGALIGGAVVIETVFSYPGIGMLIYDAALARDYPLLQGAFLILVVTVIGANLVADLTYPYLDPRTGQTAEETKL
jgi:peptide/nickel transport system permease protein